MTTINNIIGLPDQLKKIKENDDLKQVRNQNSPKQAQVSDNVSQKPGDSVDISPAARSLLSRSEEVQQYVQEMESVKTLDSNELETIRERVDGNFYSQSHVEEQIADAVVSSGVEETDTEESVRSTEPGDSDPLEQIRERVKNNYYSNSEVVDVIAEKMINPAR